MSNGPRKPIVRSLVLAPELTELEKARRFVAEDAAAGGFPESRVFDIMVACSEAAANAIEHAPIKGEVIIKTMLHPDRLEVQIEGPGEFQAPQRLTDGHSHRGLGLPLMARFSDHLALYSGPRGGTLVSLTFYRPGAEPSESETIPPSVRELVEENELVSAIASNAPVGLYLLGPDMRYKWANPAYRSFLKEPYRSSDLTGLFIGDVVPGIEQSGILAELRQASQTGVPVLLTERELVGFASGPTWWSRSLVPLTGDREQPPYDLLVVVTDDTERKSAELALRESQQTLQTFFESSPFPMGIGELDGDQTRVVSANRATCTLLGADLESVGDRICREWGVPEDLERLWVDGIRQSEDEGKPVTFEYFDGRLVATPWVRATVSALGPGASGGTRYLFVAEDITERRRVEQSLRDSEKTYRELFETMWDGLCECELLRDQEGEVVDARVLEANMALQTVFGLQPDEVRGKLATEIVANPDEWWLRTAAAIVETGEPLYFQRYVPTLGVWLDATIFPSGGERFIVVYDDITDRKRGEESLQAELTRTEVLRAIAAKAAETSDVRALATSVLDICRRLLGAKTGLVHEADEQAGVLRALALTGYPEDFDRVVRELRFDDPLAPSAIAYRRGTVITYDSPLVPPHMAERERLAGITTYRWAALPIHVKGEVTGVLGLTFGERRPFEQGEIDLFQAVADQLGVGIARARADSALRQNEEKYRDLFNSIDQGFLIMDVLFDEQGRAVDLCFVEANPAAVRMLGRDLTDCHLRDVVPIFDESWSEASARVAVSGESVSMRRYSESDDKWYDLYLFKIGDGDTRRIGNIFLDVTEEVRAESNLQFMADVDELLSGSLHADDIVPAVGARLGEHLGVDNFVVAEAAEEIDRAIVLSAWRNERSARLLETYRLSELNGPDYWRAMHSGEPFVVCDTAADPRADAERHGAFGVRAFIVVPFDRDGRWKYLVSVDSVSPRAWAAAEVGVVREVANRVVVRLERARAEAALRESEEQYRALAEENERLYRQQLDIAERLQLALLNIPSDIGRVRLGHLYRSATEAAKVGGDFYDVFEVKDDNIAILMGDVAGHGIQAARTGTLVKDVVHAFTHQSLRTHEVLRRTNLLLIEKDLPGFVTLFLGILDPKAGLLRYSSAGHPESMIKRASGEIEMLGCGTSPLGVYPDASWKAHEIALQPEDVLLLYTDGVTEARRDSEFFGEKRLERLLKRKRISVGRLPHLILDQVLAFSGGTLQDDAAVLAVSLTEPPDGIPPKPFPVQQKLLDG